MVLSSAMRLIIVADDCKAPSCTSAKDSAFWIFAMTDLLLLIAELSFIETARPPASSAGFTILLPLESLVRLFCRLALLTDREKAALVAAVFDSIDKAIYVNSFHMVFFGVFIRVAVMLYFVTCLPVPTLRLRLVTKCCILRGR